MTATRLHRPGYLDIVTDFGCIGDGTTDNQANLVLAAAAAKLQGKALHIPAGVFLHSAHWEVDSIQVFGDGDVSELKATGVLNNAAVYLLGTDVAIRNVKVTTAWASGVRNGNWDTGILLSSFTYGVVEGCTVVGAASSCIRVQNGAYAKVLGNTCKSGQGDTIEITGGVSGAGEGAVGCHHVVVANNIVYDSDDDNIAIVSYTTTGLVEWVTISGNACYGTGTASRGVVVAGGNHVSITGNIVQHMRSGGIEATTDASYGTYGCNNISIVGNTISDWNTANVGHGGIDAGGTSARPSSKITISGNTVLGVATGRALYLRTYLTGVIVTANTFATTVSNNGIMCSATDVIIADNYLYDIGLYGVYCDASCAGALHITGNIFTNTNSYSGNLAGIDVINVQAASGLAHIVIRDNWHSNPGGHVTDYLVSCDNPNAFVTGNRSSTIAETAYFVSSGGPAQRELALKRESYGTVAPTTGTWAVGDRVWNTAPAAAGTLGWVCTTAGTPGTWKVFGSIAA